MEQQQQLQDQSLNTDQNLINNTQQQQDIQSNQFGDISIQVSQPQENNENNNGIEKCQKEDLDSDTESDLENEQLIDDAQKDFKTQTSFKNFKSKNIPKLMKQKTNQMDLQAVDDLTKNIETQHLQNRSRNSSYIPQPSQEEEQKQEKKKIAFTEDQAAIKIQTFYRKQKAFKHYKKHIKKRARYRMHVIKELVNTEVRYVERLSKLRNNGQIPLQTILGLEKTKKIFSNMEVIVSLNTKFSNDLQQRLNNNFGFYTKIADIAAMCIPFFKLYGEYFNNLDKAQEFIDNLKENDEQFKEFLGQTERTDKFCNQEIKTLLIDPVFRLPKYVLLFKDLLKNTDEDHPDYKDTKKALTESESLNRHIDDRLKQLISNSKKKDLHQLYCSSQNPNLKILDDPKRQFLFEDSLNFIHNQEVKPVLVYFLSDLLIITERVISKGLKLNSQDEDQYKLVTYLYLNDLSFTKNVPDQKYFKFLFRINGKNDCLTFIATDQDDKKAKMDQIKEIIDHIKKDNKKEGGVTNYPIQVTVLGTEERNSTTFKKYTIYIVEVMIADIPQKIFVRYSEMVEFEKRIRKDVKNIQLPNLRTYNWLTAHKTKTIEQRKLLIENFIQKVLQSDQIMQSQRKNEILQFLGLPGQFYELPENYEKIKQEDKGVPWLYDRSSQSEEDSLKFSQKLTQKSQTLGNSDLKEELDDDEDLEEKKSNQRKSQDCNRQTSIQSFSANHLLSLSKLKGANSKRYNTERLSEVFSQTDSKQQEIQIECLDDARVTCYITPSSRSFEVIQHIAEYIKLQNYLDFKLFLVDEKHNIRVLDDDEQIWRLVVPLEKKQNIFKQFGKNIEKTLGIKKEEKQRIIFKKYLWLDQELEEIDYRSDLVRLHLLRCQIFEDIHNMKHMLDFKSYSLFTALNIYINHPEFIQDMVNSRGSYNPQQLKQGGNEVQRMILLNRAKELIPHIIFNANNANNWVENISSYICSIAKELDKIAQENQDMSEEDLLQNMRQSSVEERKEIYTEKQMLAEMVVINSIKQNILFGVTIYFVQTYKKTMQKAIKLGIDIQNNIWFGVKHDCIMFLKPNNKEKMRQYSLEQITNIEVHPQSIILTLEGEEIDFRFNTFQSYEISQLINEYKAIRSECLKIQQEEQGLLMLSQDLENSQQQQQQQIKQ